MSENIEAGWTLETVQQLKAMAQEGVSPSVMSLKLKRPVTAIHAKLAELGITPAAGPETRAIQPMDPTPSASSRGRESGARDPDPQVLQIRRC